MVNGVGVKVKEKAPSVETRLFLVAETGLELASASGGYELPATQ